MGFFRKLKSIGSVFLGKPITTELIATEAAKLAVKEGKKVIAKKKLKKEEENGNSGNQRELWRNAKTSAR